MIHKEPHEPGELLRVRAKITGAVQGVGFRPTVYRLAQKLHIKGWVENTSEGVLIEAEGLKATLEDFLQKIQTQKPAQAEISEVSVSYVEPIGEEDFKIFSSKVHNQKTVKILPDLAICQNCLDDILDPNNRRFYYPFTNCTNCGPRFSIIESLPYDRENTTMRKFKMCQPCQAEYEDPLNRRFHAQPNACKSCGPHLELWNTRGCVLSTHEDALKETESLIRKGFVVAVKGLGGFHLFADAQNSEAVQRLRKRKHREEKPLALMLPSLSNVTHICEVSELEKELLACAQAPIVLLKKKVHAKALSWDISDEVAPKNPNLGVMLPYTPLHYLLLQLLDFPVVATSGNKSDEPICIDEQEALSRLNGIADAFLIHNRPIARHVDDSIVRVMGGSSMILRRARGYAPFTLEQSKNLDASLAVGAHLKNSVAFAYRNKIFLTQHIGDLDTPQALHSFEKTIEDLPKIYDFKPQRVICDAHPDYSSSQFAKKMGLPLTQVQHHYAHILSCMAEHDLKPPVLGIAWDGTGYGLDGTVWGGEFLNIGSQGFERVATLHPFLLPGGEKAIHEPIRTAISVLFEVFGNEVFASSKFSFVTNLSERNKKLFQQMLQKQINSPKTTSVGRLFDAVSALLGIRTQNHFEGQAAMELEFAISNQSVKEFYPFKIKEQNHLGSPLFVIDWRPMIQHLWKEFQSEMCLSMISAKFHNTLAEMIVEVGKMTQENRVVLSGGCFQNKYLLERSIHRLRSQGFTPFWHQRVPPNDGGVALGQLIAGARMVST